jgi:hypothetical protein
VVVDDHATSRIFLAGDTSRPASEGAGVAQRGALGTTIRVEAFRAVTVSPGQVLAVFIAALPGHVKFRIEGALSAPSLVEGCRFVNSYRHGGALEQTVGQQPEQDERRRAPSYFRGELAARDALAESDADLPDEIVQGIG